MTAFVLVALIGIFIIGAVMRNIPWLWFLAGITTWALGIWWVNNQPISGNNPMNDILLIITFLGGFGLMFMIAWRSDSSGGGSFNIRLPRFLGGMSEEEELERRNMGKLQYRSERYQERLTNASRGRRK